MSLASGAGNPGWSLSLLQSLVASQQLLFEGLFFICTRVVSFAAQEQCDTTRAQINNIPEKSHVIIIIINIQGQMISGMRVLIIQAK